MKRIILVISLCSFALFLFAGFLYAISPEEQGRIFAEENFKKYLTTVEACYKEFNYSTPEQVGKSYLGEFVKSYTILPQEFDPNKGISEQMKSMAFFVFPVMVDEEVITDYAIGLYKQEWQDAGIGGHLNKVITNVANKNKTDKKELKILRFAGEIYIIAKKDNVEYGYKAYDEKLESIPSEKLKKELIKKQKQVLDYAKSNGIEKDKIGKPSAYDPLSFEQGSKGKRLYNFLAYYFK